MRLCAHCEPGLYAKVHCEPCCCGLSANHVNIMQSPLSPLHTYTHHWPFPFYCITVHSYRRQKENSPHCWREKACGCRQERALHIERLCGPICTARAFAHTEKFHHHHLYLPPLCALIVHCLCGHQNLNSKNIHRSVCLVLQSVWSSPRKAEGPTIQLLVSPLNGF